MWLNTSKWTSWVRISGESNMAESRLSAIKSLILWLYCPQKWDYRCLFHSIKRGRVQALCYKIFDTMTLLSTEVRLLLLACLFPSSLLFGMSSGFCQTVTKNCVLLFGFVWYVGFVEKVNEVFALPESSKKNWTIWSCSCYKSPPPYSIPTSPKPS